MRARFLKMNGFSVPNHNFREVLSEGGCCRRRKFYIENSKTSFVLEGLCQGKKKQKIIFIVPFCLFQGVYCELKLFLKFLLFQGV